MKYYKEEQIRTFRPAADLSSMVSVCLRKLFEDKEKRLNDEVVKGITLRA